MNLPEPHDPQGDEISRLMTEAFKGAVEAYRGTEHARWLVSATTAENAGKAWFQEYVDGRR
ncbi:hypothetical protein UFOVP5_49 [uncultured Caudovirales phage]|uniref:Uncharacterized protein n=1 Tax=uncultured Caudovirales phage TaxID=2100421 RepID=A0A6J5KI32_9CAUD|nr:hypothetical protein UFOVP5_49 [uncultured Caudovirales phage]